MAAMLEWALCRMYVTHRIDMGFVEWESAEQLEWNIILSFGFNSVELGRFFCCFFFFLINDVRVLIRSHVVLPICHLYVYVTH